MAAIGSMEDAKREGPKIMKALVAPDNGIVRFSDVPSLRDAIAGLGFARADNVSFGPEGGRQIFFTNGIVTVRVKTRGDGFGPRKGQPHLSVGISDGAGSQWFNDLAKFNRHGHLAAKSFTSAERFKPTDHDNNPQRFVMIQGGLSPRQDDAVFDEWAARTHFPFPAGFSDAGAADI